MVKEGARKKVIIGAKLKTGAWKHWRFPDPLKYIPPKEAIDIIGWCANNHCQPHMDTPSVTFQQLVKTNYSRVVEKYRDIPQFIYELCCHSTCNQAEWYDDALTKIQEEYHWIKGVILDENMFRDGRWYVNPIPTLESARVIKKHFADPYYIGNILPSKGLLE